MRRDEDLLAESIAAARAGVRPSWLRWWWWGARRRKAWLAARELVAQQERALLAAAIARPLHALRDVARVTGDADALRALAQLEEERLVTRG